MNNIKPSQITCAVIAYALFTLKISFNDKFWIKEFEVFTGYSIEELMH